MLCSHEHHKVGVFPPLPDFRFLFLIYLSQRSLNIYFDTSLLIDMNLKGKTSLSLCHKSVS